MKASYKLIWKDSAKKELKFLPKKQITVIPTKIEALSQNPFPPGTVKIVDSECS
jgi:mRNA-degrading endonuclease RelE of RelBE toxin-antitoxin system